MAEGVLQAGGRMADGRGRVSHHQTNHYKCTPSSSTLPPPRPSAIFLTLSSGPSHPSRHHPPQRLSCTIGPLLERPDTLQSQCPLLLQVLSAGPLPTGS